MMLVVCDSNKIIVILYTGCVFLSVSPWAWRIHALHFFHVGPRHNLFYNLNRLFKNDDYLIGMRMATHKWRKLVLTINPTHYMCIDDGI